jgi:hypothetical protein
MSMGFKISDDEESKRGMANAGSIDTDDDIVSKVIVHFLLIYGLLSIIADVIRFIQQK